MSTGGQQISAEKKYLQKLEKDLRQLKSNQSVLTVVDPKMFEIATDKKLGDHLVANFGMSGGTTQCIVIHRPIGTDYTMPKDKSWVISQVRDISGFQATEFHPGLDKLEKNIRENTLKISISKGLITKKPDGKVYYTPQDDVPKDKLISEAKARRIEYAGVKGIKTKEAPSYLYFMAKQHAMLEMKYSQGLYYSAEFKAEVLPDLKKIEKHRPHLMTMMHQEAVPWLYGAEFSQLNQLYYNRMLGRNIAPVEVIPEDYPVLTYTFPVLGKIFPDFGQMQLLQDALLEYAAANKAKNIAVANAKAKASSGTKEEKKALSAEVIETNDLLNKSKAKVNRLDVDFPPEAYIMTELVLLKKSDMV